MIEISGIELHTFSKSFTKESKKIITFAFKNKVTKTKNPCAFVDETSLKWNESLELPLAYDQNFDFEITNLHQFGYNPEELQTLMHGTIQISKDQNKSKWDVFVNGQNKAIGFLLVNFAKTEKKKIVHQSSSANAITQILVRNVSKAPQTAYLTLNNGKKVIKSKLVDSVRGQFIYFLPASQSQFIKSINQIDGLIIQFYSENDQLIGGSKLIFKNNAKVAKQDLTKANKKVGEIYFQLMEQSAKIKSPPKKIHKKKTDTDTTIGKSSSSVSLYKLKSMSESIISNLGQSQFLSSSRHKRMSVMFNNGDVVFPSEKRFQIYQDRQTDVISYSKLPSMKYEDPTSKKYYKGASIGIGTKHDFTHLYKQNPGVGQYKLPSIFDRY